MKRVMFFVLCSVLQIQAFAYIVAHQGKRDYSAEIPEFTSSVFLCPKGYDVTYDLNGVAFIVDGRTESGSIQYHPYLKGMGTEASEGKPAALFDLLLIDIGSHESVDSIQLYPSPSYLYSMYLTPSHMDVPEIEEPVKNVITPYSGYDRESPVEIVGITNYNGRNILALRVYPIAYDYANGNVKVYDKIHFVVECSGGIEKESDLSQIPVPVRNNLKRVKGVSYDNDDDIDLDPDGNGDKLEPFP